MPSEDEMYKKLVWENGCEKKWGRGWEMHQTLSEGEREGKKVGWEHLSKQ